VHSGSVGFFFGARVAERFMATFAETMVAKYEALLQTASGMDTVSVDGDIFFLELSGGRLICLSWPAARAGAAAGSGRYKSA